MKRNMKKTLVSGLALSMLLPLVPMEPAEAAGWKQDGAGWWWQEDNASYPVNTWKQIYGQWYYFDNNGYMLDEGWHWIDGNCYYMYAGGAMASNTWIDGSYVNASGAWVTDHWVSSANGWWYQHADGSYPVNAWEMIGGSWYYFDNNGYMLDEGWHWINGSCYYMYAGGAMASNTWIGGSYVNASGAWVTDHWVSSANGWWYQRADGSYPANVWEMIGGSWYYFDSNGYMLDKGWHWINGNYYYMYAGGAMASNTWIGDYYLRANGSMATNQWIGNCWVGADGKWVPGKDQNDRQPEYSYEVYALKPFETTYTGEFCMVYLKTENPNEEDIEFTNVGSSWNFDDVDYTYDDNLISYIEKVDGGYLLSIYTGKAGSVPVKIYEKDLLVKEFSIEVLDYSAANEAYMKQILDKVTTPDMTPIEKMEKVSEYLLANFDYYTCFTDENGGQGGYAWLMTESGVWWENYQLNSYDSPALLCKFAEMIGWFEDIHNCYGDYPYGTAEWYMWHYTCRVKYQGKEYNFQGCPYSGNLVDKDNMEYVSFAPGSDVFGERLA